MKKFLAAFVVGLVFIGSSYAGKGYSSGGGRSYSSSSRGYSSSSSFKPSVSSKPFVTPSSKPFVTPSSKPSVTPSSGKSYSSGNKSYSSTPSKKPDSSFQSLSANEQKKVESRVAYQKAVAPKETYRTPKGNDVAIKGDDKKVIQIRSMDSEKWVSRVERERHFYHHYYNYSGPVVTYNDPYNTFFWLWLLDRSVDDRARWAYHHRNDMDEARYRDLLAKDAKLETRIRELEKEKLARDPNYVPSGMVDPDLQYTGDYVNAVYNPTPRNSIEYGGLWAVIKWCFYISLVVAFFLFVIWFIFIKEW